MRRLLELTLLTSVAVFLLPTKADAQVVQLPTFQQFSTNSSVLVPDRGSAYLGGVNRAAYGSTRRGPFNRGIGRSIGGSGVSLHATIIDHTELDRAVLAEAASRRGAKFDVLGREIATGKTRLGRDALSPTSTSPAALSREEEVRRKAAFLSRHVSRSGSRR